MSKKNEYAGKSLGYATPMKRDAKNNALPGEVVHITPYAADGAQVTSNEAHDGHYETRGGKVVWVTTKGDLHSVPKTDEMEGSTGKRIYTEGAKSGKTEGYSVMQPSSHQGETNADGSNPRNPNR